MDSTAIGQRIKAARQSAGLSQSRLAELLGVTQPTVSGWEGHSEPSVQMLLRIAEALGTRASVLLGEDE